MKVKELIEELQKCDQEKEVWVSHYDIIEGGWNEPPHINENDYRVFIE